MKRLGVGSLCQASQTGPIAQLGERRVRNAEVEGSNPFRSNPLLCKDLCRASARRFSCVSAASSFIPFFDASLSVH